MPSDFPCEASRTTDCVDVLVPAPGVTMSIMMKIDRVYWHRHSLLWPARIRGLYLKAAVQVRDANNLHLKDPGHVRALSWLRWRIIRPLLLFGRTACTRPPILSRATALMGGDV